jgi:hypothetical protein
VLFSLLVVSYRKITTPPIFSSSSSLAVVVVVKLTVLAWFGGSLRYWPQQKRVFFGVVSELVVVASQHVHCCWRASSHCTRLPLLCAARSHGGGSWSSCPRTSGILVFLVYQEFNPVVVVNIFAFS